MQLTKSPGDYRLLEASSRRHSRDVTRQHEHVSWCTAVTHTAARAAIIATLVPNVTIRSNRSTGPDCTACTASNKISQQPIRLCTPHMVIGPACTYTRLASRRRPESRLAMWEEVRHHCPLIRLCALLGYGCTQPRTRNLCCTPVESRSDPIQIHDSISIHRTAVCILL